MRTITSVVLVCSLLATDAVAADGTGPLAPGKPVGVKRAQSFDDNTVLYVVGAAGIIAGIALIASSGGSNSAAQGGGTTTTPSGGTTTTTTTTTTTS